MKKEGEKRDAFLDHLTELLNDPPAGASPSCSAAGLIEACPELQLRLLAGTAGLARNVCWARPRRCGVALAGYVDQPCEGAVFMLGAGERAFLADLAPPRASALLAPLFKHPPGCFVVPDMPEDAPQDFVLPQFLHMAQTNGVPVLAGEAPYAFMEQRLHLALEEATARTVTTHAGLVVYHGLGLMLVGKSGIGKSDTALEMVLAGHGLVADDVVRLHRDPMGRIIGSAGPHVAGHMDVRGVGLVDLPRLMGAQVLLEAHPVDVVLYLQEFDARSWKHFDAVSELSIMGVRVPMIHLPASRGRHMAALVDLALRNYLQARRDGASGAERLSGALDQALGKGAAGQVDLSE